tara:strand:+ start:217 stop:531 length:315 start_codon:yes stop_codon:yes gene_type:complete
MNVKELGFRYVVEKGGVSYDERGYLRYDFTKLLGEDIKHRFSWSNLRNATQFYTEKRAREMAEESGLDGMKVVIKTRAYRQDTMKPYDDHGCGGTWLWECKGSV